MIIDQSDGRTGEIDVLGKLGIDVELFDHPIPQRCAHGWCIDAGYLLGLEVQHHLHLVSLLLHLGRLLDLRSPLFSHDSCRPASTANTIEIVVAATRAAATTPVATAAALFLRTSRLNCSAVAACHDRLVRQIATDVIGEIADGLVPLITILLQSLQTDRLEITRRFELMSLSLAG